MTNSEAFESVAEQLKKGKLEELRGANVKNSGEDIEMIPAVNADNSEDPSDEHAVVSIVITADGTHCMENVTNKASLRDMQPEDSAPETKNSGTSSGLTGPADNEMLRNGGQRQVAKATVPVSKRPTAFGALLGKSASGRRPNLFPGLSIGQSQSKVDKIASSVVLPFHHFSGAAKPPSSVLKVRAGGPQVPENHKDGNCEPEDTEMSEPPPEVPTATGQRFHSLNEERNLQQNRNTPQEPEFKDQLKAFEYTEARKNVSFACCIRCSNSIRCWRECLFFPACHSHHETPPCHQTSPPPQDKAATLSRCDVDLHLACRPASNLAEERAQLVLILALTLGIRLRLGGDLVLWLRWGIALGL
ncbi:hypothetical protein PR202_ga00415 [Eleusine coracana subsp. coracana]|uniref:Uncharacterized protein n=1 Tax=Eleusine coracana subsp. coracana TaxID=191504 RepID=A0AAV5BCZ8_ELECO|nr:hypothetical protein PR202_ga00415 [Eleusine coracana subsp. coracana]